MTKIQTIEAKVREANPETMELSFGCVILLKGVSEDEQGKIVVVRHSNKWLHYLKDGIGLSQLMAYPNENIPNEILGHPLYPAHLLVALDNMLYMIDGMGNLYKMKMKLSDKLPQFDTSFNPIKLNLTQPLLPQLQANSELVDVIYNLIK